MQAALIILEIYWIEYFKIVFLNIYNCVYKTHFRKSSHIIMLASYGYSYIATIDS